MAKITLTIEADSDGDLHQALAGLCDRMEGVQRTPDLGYDSAGERMPNLGSAFTAYESSEERPPLRDDDGRRNVEGRRRRTKAELEQDPIWRAKNGYPPLPPAQNAASLPASSGPSPASGGNGMFGAFGSSQQSGKGVEAQVDPATVLFGIGGAKRSADPAPVATAVIEGGDEAAAFKAAFRDSMARRGAKGTQDILVATAGVRMTAEVKPEQYAAVTAAFMAA